MNKVTDPAFRYFPVKIFAITLILPCLLLLCIEALAWLAGAGYPSSLFINEGGPDGKVYLRANYRVGQRFFPGTLARKPLPEIMAAEKPVGRMRIFVLGESAARGEQLADFSFSRMLEAAINHEKPQKIVEVINTGIPAINSWVLREFAREVVNYQADLVIVFAGHNEFIGPYGPAGVSGTPRSRAAVLTGIWASSLRLIQLLKGDRIPAELHSGWRGLEMFFKNLILPGSKAIRLCLENWQANLNDIFSVVREAGVPVIWCRVPVNQRECPPFASDESILDEQTRAAIASISQTVDKGDFAEAMHTIEKLRGDCEEHALLNYFEGQSQLALGKTIEAANCFKKALANDCFRVRTTVQFNDSAAECARLNGAREANIEQTFIENSQHGIIGSDLIYDHVHLTFKGHYLTAAALFKTIQATMPRTAEQLPQKFPEFEEMSAIMGFTSQDAIDNLVHIIGSLSRPPFSLQAGHKQRLKKLEEELGKEKQRHQPDTCIIMTRAAISGQQQQDWAA
jgi:lysophospholipase L1-like esterase